MEIDTFDSVERLVTNKENNQVEFKETTGQLDRGMETLCAFLNGIGGTVLFGVTDKGKIIGQELSDKTKRDIVEAVKRIEPLVDVRISYIQLPDSLRQVISLHVEPQLYARPFTYKGRAYCRMESVTTIMTQENYNSLLLQRGGKYGWEALPNIDLQIEKLEKNAILGAVRMGIESGRLPETTMREDIPTILEKFNLTSNGGILRNAAAILFGEDLSDYPQCILRMARFKGIGKDEFIDNQRISGNIFRLLDAAMAFFFKHLSLSGKVEGLYRDEELAIPYKALRECCINAFSHRVYHKPGSSVSIAIYDDRVEITNTGTFPADMTIERLLNTHDSDPQNPIIANVLYKSKVLESWGRGIALMLSECHRVGLPEPEFHTDGMFVWVVFHYKVTDQVTDQVLRLVTILENKRLSIRQIMEDLGLSHRYTFRTNYLLPALKSGYIVSDYPEQPNHPKQKYRLTEKGKALLQ